MFFKHPSVAISRLDPQRNVFVVLQLVCRVRLTSPHSGPTRKYSVESRRTVSIRHTFRSLKR